MNSIKYFSVFVFIIGSLALPGCGGGSKDEAPIEKRTAGHETVTLTAKSISDIGLNFFTAAVKPVTGSLTAPARVLPNQDLESQVGSLVQGRVHQIFVNVGDQVAAGQILMTVKGLDIGAMKAGFLKAKATHDYTKANYERQKKLFEENIGSQKAVLETQAEYEKALAEYTAEDRRIHSVDLTDEEILSGKIGDEHSSGTLPVKSHINGVVVERNVVVGQYVDAAITAFKVINSRSVWIDGQIYEKDLARIPQNTSALFATAAYPGEVFHGRIITVGQTVDEQSRTITVRGEFNNPARKLKPHMFGELNIPNRGNSKALMVPDEAVVKETGQHFVFVRMNDTTFVKRIVVTGVTADTMIEIREGLSEGDIVAWKGVFYLKSDLKKDDAGGE